MSYDQLLNGLYDVGIFDEYENLILNEFVDFIKKWCHDLQFDIESKNNNDVQCVFLV